MSVVRRACALALLVTALVTALTACTSGGDDPKADPTPTITSLSDLASEDPTIVRGEFCPRVAPGAIEEALGAEPSDSTSWRNGDRARVADGVRDVVHEYGCAWTTSDGAARAWVFAPPVTTVRARELGRVATRAKGCRALSDAEPFGTSSVATTCGKADDAVTTYHGLFGDAWLSCSLGGEDAERTGRWCVSVAQAAAAA